MDDLIIGGISRYEKLNQAFARKLFHLETTIIEKLNQKIGEAKTENLLEFFGEFYKNTMSRSQA